MQRIDRYERGDHDDPYMPPHASDEYRLLAKRSVSNWMGVLISTPVQAMYVDNFRRGQAAVRGSDGAALPEWTHWQNSRLDARQTSVHRGAVKFGHSFTITEKTDKGTRTKGLSALNTSALWEDPANDDAPVVALTITQEAAEGSRGKARMWDGALEYEVTFGALLDDDSLTVTEVGKHGNSECPVTRFAAHIDLEGRTVGVVEPLIPLQDRINQTIMDLLVAQSYTAHVVRYTTGMAPPLKMVPVKDESGEVVDWQPERGPDGRPIPANINVNSSRFLFAEDPDVRFGSLEGGPLSGFIESIDMSIRHLAAIGQMPPHHLLGQIANLSAEALLAAETALSRKVEEFRKLMGEAWERVFRLAAELEGVEASALDYSGEVIWRDMEMRSLAQSADGLGKLREQLAIPVKGLWARVPGVTKNELDQWSALAEQENADLQLVDALLRSTGEDPADGRESR
ncbi:hypothetical protein FHR83_007097 [Actinoplanes campanulatus]|uniref:Phage portal protein, SPP1 Gp6-like n=1 Tax=Actinoplanes campanulatus TaxID=113559 RepID=A0A7W5AN75_9ACTN|nr:hypothetical protein [Actinoplanes campanulatus]